MIGENINGGHVSLSQVYEIKRFMGRQRKQARSQRNSFATNKHGMKFLWEGKYHFRSNIHTLCRIKLRYSESATRAAAAAAAAAIADFVVTSFRCGSLFTIVTRILLRFSCDFLASRNSDRSLIRSLTHRQINYWRSDRHEWSGWITKASEVEFNCNWN
jgi:hypothetical protein